MTTSDPVTTVTTDNKINDTPTITKRKVGRPGRKRIDVESKNKRTQQNRIAQRAYRERKEQKLKNLENKIVWLEQLNLQNTNEINFIHYNLRRLLNDLKQYRSFNDEDNVLLKFLNEKNEIKALINNELNKIDNNLKGSNNSNNTNSSSSSNDSSTDNRITPSPDLNFKNDIQSFSNTNNNFNLTNTWVTSTTTTTTNNNNLNNYDSSPDLIESNINNNNNNKIWDSFPMLNNFTSTSSDDLFDFNNVFEDNEKNEDISTIKNTNDNNNDIDTFLNNIAYPNIWDNSTKDILLNENINNNNDLASNLNILPFDCNCGGACFNNQMSFENKFYENSNNVCNSACNSACNSDEEEEETYTDDNENATIKCDLLTRHLLNKESIQSIINDKNFYNNNSTTNTINNKSPLSCSHFIRRIKLKNETSFEDEIEKLCNELMVKCRHDPSNESILLEKRELKKAIAS